MKKIRLFLLAVTLCLLFSTPLIAELPKEGGVMVVARGADGNGFDPAYETDGPSFVVCNNIYEALVKYKPTSMDVEPLLAKAWEVSDDGLKYTFHLHEGVTFHDGTQFDADAAAFTFVRLMTTPKVNWFGKGWEIPKQTRKAIFWKVMQMDDTIDYVDAKDKNTLVFHLKKPNAPFIQNLAMDFGSIISPTAYLKNPDEFLRNPVGTGPFVFEQWIRDDRIVLKKNTEYWNKKNGGPYLDKLIFRTVPENSVRFLSLMTGEIQICLDPSISDMTVAQKADNVVFSTVTSYNFCYLGFNHAKPLWQNVHMRSAVAHAINYDAIIQGIYGKLGERAVNPLPKGLLGYNEKIVGYEYNVELAKKELALAGYPEGKGLPTVTIYALPISRVYLPEGLKAATLIMGDLNNAGIPSRIMSYDYATFQRKQQQQDPEMDLFELGWTSDNGDPDNTLSVLFDGLASESVRTQWKNEKYHELMIKGVTTPDPARRRAIYNEALEIIHDDVAVIPLAHAKRLFFYSPRVQNFVPHPVRYCYKDLWLK
jgi:peptide/nickel transport system substrate-binding protein